MNEMFPENKLAAESNGLIERAKPFLEAYRDRLIADDARSYAEGDTNAELANVELEMLAEFLMDVCHATCND